MKVHWTQEMRRQLYRLVVVKEGPYRKWKQKGPTPALLRELAKALSRRFAQSISTGAVRGQINWAISMQTHVNNSGYFWNLVLNKAAAQEEGFIDRALIPEQATFTYRKR